MVTIKRIVNTKFWEDETVLDTYSVEDKYFLLYLMTNTKTTQLGIYQLPKKLISFQTGYTSEVIEVLIQRFSDKYKNIVYNHKTQEIAVLNSLKYSIVKGGKPVSDLLTRELIQVNDEQLIQAVYNNMKNWWENSTREFDKTIKELFEEELSKRKVPKEKNVNENDNDNDNDDSYHDSYHESLEVDKVVKDFPFTLKNNETYYLTKELYQQFKDTYKNIFIEQEFKKMETWLITNPDKRKTERGMPKFINSWLSRTSEIPTETVKPKKVVVEDEQEFTEEQSQELLDNWAKWGEKYKK